MIEFLKDHVDQNNREIRMNQEEIERMLSGSAADARQKDLDSLKAANEQLREENADFIHMEQELSDFLYKYDYIEIDSPAGVPYTTQADQILAQTVSGKLEFNPAHPGFNDPEFFHRLLKYYENREDYEMCDRLIRTRRSF